MATRAPGSLPSDTEKNPKGVNAVTMTSPIEQEVVDVEKNVKEKGSSQQRSEDAMEKEILSNKRKLVEFETVKLSEECYAILQNKLPSKLKDPGSFSIPCTIESSFFSKTLCDLGASINLMPYSCFEKLGIGEVKPTTISLQLADRSIKYPRGVVDDVLVKVDKFIFLVDFVLLDMEEDHEIPLFLCRPFLATGKALIDVHKGTGEEKLLRVLRENIKAIGWSIADIKGITSSIFSCSDPTSKASKPSYARGGKERGDKATGHRPLTNLLIKDVRFDFSDECVQAFQVLKEKLITAPVMIAPDCGSPFEVICDASDTALGQFWDKRGRNASMSSTMLEFDLDIIDKKRTEKQVADHLSRFENPSRGNEIIRDDFSDEQLFEVNSLPWLDSYENTKLYKEKTKCWHDQNIVHREFVVGKLVLLYNSRLKLMSGKLHSRWSGSYTITQIFPYGTIEITSEATGAFKVNGHRLKVYHGGTMPDEPTTVGLQDPN
ncbi:uncharacterized protein [Primulina eburnea]|uniref:uncharacterized protein n=1 Tax=Primulina eburnea TaxID=1245227 RepID=UPI003C6BDB86